MEDKKFEVDTEIPYRLYFGDRKEVDWVDVKDIYDNKVERIIFEDLSPILKIIQFKDEYFLEIKKEKSIWRLYYWGFPIIRLKLIEPVIIDDISSKGEIIYEREN